MTDLACCIKHRGDGFQSDCGECNELRAEKISMLKEGYMVACSSFGPGVSDDLTTSERARLRAMSVEERIAEAAGQS